MVAALNPPSDLPQRNVSVRSAQSITGVRSLQAFYFVCEFWGSQWHRLQSVNLRQATANLKQTEVCATIGLTVGPLPQFGVSTRLPAIQIAKQV